MPSWLHSGPARRTKGRAKPKYTCTLILGCVKPPLGCPCWPHLGLCMPMWMPSWLHSGPTRRTKGRAKPKYVYFDFGLRWRSYWGALFGLKNPPLIFRQHPSKELEAAWDSGFWKPWFNMKKPIDVTLRPKGPIYI